MVKDVLDSDDDLLPKLLQVKKPAAKKLPFGNSPSKSNKPVTKSNKGTISKPHYDPFTAQNLLKEQQDKPRTKHASQEEAMQFGC